MPIRLDVAYFLILLLVGASGYGLYRLQRHRRAKRDIMSGRNRARRKDVKD